jgi:hypothetical protein
MFVPINTYCYGNNLCSIGKQSDQVYWENHKIEPAR